MPNKSIIEDIVSDKPIDLSDDQLNKVSSLAQYQVDLQRKIAEKDAEMKTLKEEYRKIAEDQLPSAMEELNLSKVELTDGSSVKVSRFYSAKIWEDKKEGAYDWLRENNLGDIIKHNVTVSFFKSEDKKANKLKSELEQQGFAPSDKEWIEPMTLKGLAREQEENGTPLPNKHFDVFVGLRAKIT